jgi:hypothetical protein
MIFGVGVFTKICLAGMNFVKIRSLAVILYLGTQMNLYPYCLYFMTDLGAIRCCLILSFVKILSLAAILREANEFIPVLSVFRD